MPIYKTNKKRDGLFLYTVRVNYTDKNGKAHSLTRTAVGAEAAKLLEFEHAAFLRDKIAELKGEKK